MLRTPTDLDQSAEDTMPTARRGFAALITIATLWLLAAHPYTPNDSTVPVESDWKARAAAWFTADDIAGRRQEMRKMTGALRRACQYCHTPDFTAYTDKLTVSRQMMALTAEHGVPCADCHGGRDELTELGRRSQPMWALAVEKKVFCESCHVPKKRFGVLTAEGERFKREEWAAWQKAHPAAKPAAKPAVPAKPATPAPTAP